MGATSFFPAFGDPDEIADVDGSSFAEPDGTKHRIEVLEGGGSLIVRVTLKDSARPVDLLFKREQAAGFGFGVASVLQRLGIE